jgi:hypothetical protein
VCSKPKGQDIDTKSKNKILMKLKDKNTKWMIFFSELCFYWQFFLFFQLLGDLKNPRYTVEALLNPLKTVWADPGMCNATFSCKLLPIILLVFLF